MRKNGRSLAGGWATKQHRSGPEVTTTRGGRDTQEGWLDCRGEFALFHKNNNQLSHEPDSSANRRIGRPAPTPRIGARRPNHQSIDFDASDPIKPKDRTRRTRNSQRSPASKPSTHKSTQNRNPIAPTANVATSAKLRPHRHPPPGKFLRVFPHNTGIFDRRFKNAHIISAALPMAVGPSLRTSNLASGAGETLAQCKTHHDVFPNQTSPSGTARAGPRYASSLRRSVFMCLGRVPCPRPGCCSIAQVMPPLPV